MPEIVTRSPAAGLTLRGGCEDQRLAIAGVHQIVGLVVIAVALNEGTAREVLDNLWRLNSPDIRAISLGRAFRNCR